MSTVPFPATPHPSTVRAHTETVYLVLLLRPLIIRRFEVGGTATEVGGMVEYMTCKYHDGGSGGEEFLQTFSNNKGFSYHVTCQYTIGAVWLSP